MLLPVQAARLMVLPAADVEAFLQPIKTARQRLQDFSVCTIPLSGPEPWFLEETLPLGEKSGS